MEFTQSSEILAPFGVGTENALQLSIKALSPAFYGFIKKLVAQGSYSLAGLLDTKTHPSQILIDFATFDSCLKTTLMQDLLELQACVISFHFYSELELDFTSRLSSLCKQELNRIVDFPPVSSVAANALDFVLSYQDVSSDMSELAEKKGLSLVDALKEHIAHSLNQMESSSTLSQSALSSIKTRKTEKLLQRSYGHMIENAENMSIALSEMPMSLHVQAHAASASVDSLGHYKDYIKKRSEFYDIAQQLRESNYRLFKLYLYRKDYIKLAEKLHSAFSPSRLALRLLFDAYQAKQKLRFDEENQDVTLESLIYAERLAFSLAQQGETAEDIAIVQKKLFELCLKNNTKISHLLETEVLQLNPKLRKESLINAQLHLRLNDLDYPLSAACRKHILEIAQIASNTNRTK